MPSTPIVTLSAVTIVAALGVLGCSRDAPPAAGPIPEASRTTTVLAPPPAAPLPSADALAGVVYKLADTSVPAEQKVGLVQYATVDDEPVLTNFGEALKASGFTPLNVTLADIAWAGQPGNVTATVTLGTTDPAVKPFSYPMEFSPVRDAWQLTRRTADQLLPLVATTGPTPSS